MRRVARHFSSILAVASLLLCAATCLLWARGRERGEMLGCRQYRDDGYQVTETQTGMFSFRGGLGFGRRYLSGPSADPPTDFSNPHRTGFHFDAYNTVDEDDRYPFTMNPPTWWERIGFVFKFTADGFNQAGDDMEYGVTIPCWFLAGMFALVPASVYASRIIRHRRETNNLCPTCGYDLRATPDRCPECGTSREMQK